MRCRLMPVLLAWAASAAAGEAGGPAAWTREASGHVWSYLPGTSVWSTAATTVGPARRLVAAGSYDRNVYAFEAATGAEAWRFTTGNRVPSAPLFWSSEERTWLFVTSNDRTVYALDARDGRRIWSRAVADYEATLGGALLSAPCLGTAGGEPTLFVGFRVWDKSLAHGVQSAGVIALSASDGRVRWRRPLLDNRMSDPVFAVVGGRGTLFVSSEDGNLRALDADRGEVLWRHTEPMPIVARPLLVNAGGRPQVWVGSLSGAVRCLDAATGAVLRSFTTGNWVTGGAAVLRRGGRELVVFGSHDQVLYCVDPRTGAEVWRRRTGGPIYSTPAVADGPGGPVVVFAAWDHRLYGVDGVDGRILWTVDTGRPLWSGIPVRESYWASPIVTGAPGAEVIYFGSYGGAFRALPLAALTADPGPGAHTPPALVASLVGTMVLGALLALWLDRRGRRAGGRSAPSARGRAGR